MGLAALKVEDLPHYTYDDYAQWEGQWELINGIAYAMTPSPNLKHQDISQKIAGQLYRLLAGSKYCKPLLAVDWQITDDTVVEPDNLIVCGENPGDVKLLITPVVIFEILSPSTTRHDKIIKFQLYKEAGVKYYCIVDPDTYSASVFELYPDKNAYQEKGDWKEGKMIFDLGPCSIAFDFSELFRK
jgi:Uma2 family endonuclease